MQNSHVIKISNSAEIPEPIELDHTYQILLEGDCKDIKKSSNDDGSHTYTYNVKLLTAEIEDSRGRTLKIKDKKRQSQKLRQQIEFTRIESGSPLSSEEYYDKVMTAVRHNLQAIIIKEKI
jgi:hypothetical protein